MKRGAGGAAGRKTPTTFLRQALQRLRQDVAGQIPHLQAGADQKAVVGHRSGNVVTPRAPIPARKLVAGASRRGAATQLRTPRSGHWARMPYSSRQPGAGPRPNGCSAAGKADQWRRRWGVSARHRRTSPSSWSEHWTGTHGKACRTTCGERRAQPPVRRLGAGRKRPRSELAGQLRRESEVLASSLRNHRTVVGFSMRRPTRPTLSVLSPVGGWRIARGPQLRGRAGADERDRGLPRRTRQESEAAPVDCKRRRHPGQESPGRKGARRADRTMGAV